jgi:DNA-binding GntR family transcriptional regulator
LPASERSPGGGDEEVAEKVDELIDLLSEIERRTLASHHPRDLEWLSAAFHTAILEAARSPRLKVTRRAMSDLMPANFFAVMDRAAETEQKGQAAIFRVLKRGDSERADEEYRRLMRRMGELVADLSAERGLFDEEQRQNAEA